MGAVYNQLNLLIIPNRKFVNQCYKCLKISKLSLIARPGCGRFILRKQTSTQSRSLACLSYTKSLPISKANLPLLEKATNAAFGSLIRFWQSWYRLPSSKTSNILRCLKALFGITTIGKKRFYTFMASPQNSLATTLAKDLADDTQSKHRWPSAAGSR